MSFGNQYLYYDAGTGWEDGYFQFDYAAAPTTITFSNRDFNGRLLFPLSTTFTGTVVPPAITVGFYNSSLGNFAFSARLVYDPISTTSTTTTLSVANYTLEVGSVFNAFDNYTILFGYPEPHNFASVKYIGTLGDFTTLSDAVTWFNTVATTNITFEVDAGVFPITDTLTVDAGDRALTIVGKGSNNTILNAATGLAGKPMFNIRSRCDIHTIGAYGSTLAGYGTAGAGENFVTFDTTPSTTDESLYCEFVDIIVNGFSVGVSDTIGVSIFVFNFIIDTCPVGVLVNYSTMGVGETTIDCEVGNFVNCAVAVSLKKAELASFILSHLVFYNVNTTDIGVQYDGANYIYGTSSVLLNSSYNHIGIFTSGFNFAIQRDANIEIAGNVGVEDSAAYAKINVRDNASTTTETAVGTYYKAVFTNGSTAAAKIGLANNRMTYLSSHARSVKHWISGNLQTSGANRTIDVALRRELTLTALSASGSVVTATSSKAHNLSVGEQVQILGVTGGTVTWNGVKTVASVPTTTTFTYASTGSGTASGYASTGACGIIYAPMSVRTGSANVSVSFSILAYISQLALNEYIEIYVSSSNSSETTTLQDISWLLVSA